MISAQTERLVINITVKLPSPDISIAYSLETKDKSPEHELITFLRYVHLAYHA